MGTTSGDRRLATKHRCVAAARQPGHADGGHWACPSTETGIDRHHHAVNDLRRNTMSTDKINLDIHRILTVLPHRYPFLLVDRVLELEPHKRIKALKNVSINEPHFTGHFPKRPVMPGVLVLEALAQAAALLTFSEESHDPASTQYLFVGIDDARFKRVV